MRELRANIVILTDLISEGKASPPKFLSDLGAKLIEAWVPPIQVAFKFGGTLEFVELLLVREGKLRALDADAERLG
jgi:hypothetical protein